MAGFNLLEDYQDDPKTIIRRARANLTPPRRSSGAHPRDPPLDEHPSDPTNRLSSSVNPPTSTKSLHEYSTPSNSDLATLPCAGDGKVDIKLKLSLINMVRAIAFNGNPSEDANAHLQNFLEICGTISIKGIRQHVIQLHLFPFSLQDKAKHWFYYNLVVDIYFRHH